jgi:glutamate racemase
MKIGFFDSGLGGLTILKAVAKELPDYDYIFYGDTVNLPYGNKTEEEVYNLTLKGVEYLITAECTLIIIACNTASAETLRRLQTEYLTTKSANLKIIGVIRPTVESIDLSVSLSISLLATKRTVESNKYQMELTKLNKNNQLIQISAPDLVPLIEIGDLELATEHAIKLIDEEGGESGVVVLGCTHYTEIKKLLRSHYGNQKIILSQDEIIPKKLKDYLERHPEIESRLSRGGERNIHLTEHKLYFDKILQQLLGGVYLEE